MPGYVYGATRAKKLGPGVERPIAIDNETRRAWDDYMIANERARVEYDRKMTSLERLDTGSQWASFTEEQRQRYTEAQRERRRIARYGEQAVADGTWQEIRQARYQAAARRRARARARQRAISKRETALAAGRATA